jgi:hypothetical protein
MEYVRKISLARQIVPWHGILTLTRREEQIVVYDSYSEIINKASLPALSRQRPCS